MEPRPGWATNNTVAGDSPALSKWEINTEGYIIQWVVETTTPVVCTASGHRAWKVNRGAPPSTHTGIGAASSSTEAVRTAREACEPAQAIWPELSPLAAPAAPRKPCCSEHAKRTRE